MPNIK
jgi:hypothetical protein